MLEQNMPVSHPKLSVLIKPFLFLFLLLIFQDRGALGAKSINHSLYRPGATSSYTGEIEFSSAGKLSLVVRWLFKMGNEPSQFEKSNGLPAPIHSREAIVRNPEGGYLQQHQHVPFRSENRNGSGPLFAPPDGPTSHQVCVVHQEGEVCSMHIYMHTRHINTYRHTYMHGYINTYGHV